MNFQIGKQGVTEGVITTLENAFKTHKSIRISVLKNQQPTKDKVRAIADELVSKLKGDYKYVTIGFTIVLKKTRK